MSLRMHLIAIVAMCTLLFLSGCNKPEEAATQPFSVTTYTVVSREVPIYREWVGQTKGSFNVDIQARVEGYLDAITYTEGGNVSAGQVMFKIDPSAYRSYVSQARARLAEAQAANARARQDVARYKPLVQENAISRQEYDAAVALEQATSSSVVAMQAALDKALLDLSFCDVKAPISGVASIAKLGTGNLVGRGNNTLLAVVSKLDPIRVTFNLSEQEYLGYKRSAQAGSSAQMPVQLKLADGSLWPHIGKLVVADNAIDPATGTLRVDAEFSNPSQVLRPGQFGRVLVMTEKRQGSIVIPARAITELQGQARVAIIKNKTIAYRNVILGPRIGGAIIVESGLLPGEEIVIDGLQMIREGITVMSKPSGTAIDSILSAN